MVRLTANAVNLSAWQMSVRQLVWWQRIGGYRPAI